ncbi:hypothetical protein D6D05_06335, partial [Aureobasidium pullulans]
MTYGDHHLTFRTCISIAQIPVFSLSLLIAYYFRRTHRMGWFCIGIFSIIRLVSASCLLALINEDKYSLKATVNKQTPTPSLPKYAFLIPQFLTYIDILVAILGYTLPQPRKKQDPYAPTPYSRTSRAILMTTYIYTLSLLFILWTRRDKCPTAKPRKNALMGVV